MEATPRQLFGSKLGLILGPAGKDRYRYTIVYKVRPVREMMCRFGVCHKANAKDTIKHKDTIVMIKVDSGLFGLDTSGMLRMGQLDTMTAPTSLKFDGFKGIEVLPGNKYRTWKPNFVEGRWEANKQYMMKKLKTGGAVQVEKLFTYYPFKEALLDMPSEILHDEEAVLIPATEAVSWMQTWLKRMKGDKMQMIDDARATLNDLGSGVNAK